MPLEKEGLITCVGQPLMPDRKIAADSNCFFGLPIFSHKKSNLSGKCIEFLTARVFPHFILLYDIFRTRSRSKTFLEFRCLTFQNKIKVFDIHQFLCFKVK